MAQNGFIALEQQSQALKENADVISFIRSHLDIISTSIDLLEVCWFENNNDPMKHLKKIKQEMQIIRLYLDV
jgi:hypothetical protein